MTDPRPTGSTPAPSTTTRSAAVVGRGLAWWARWLHFYTSAIGFAAIVFFGVTGLTLNHSDAWETGDPVVREFTGKVDPAWCAEVNGNETARARLVTYLRAQHGLRGDVRDVHLDDDECSVFLVAPAYAADIFIEKASGQYRGQETRRASLTLMDDLHKGRYGGGVWSAVIDVAAVLTTVSALTGIWLLFYVKNRRVAGLVVTVIGALALLVAYGVGVP